MLNRQPFTNLKGKVGWNLNLAPSITVAPSTLKRQVKTHRWLTCYLWHFLKVLRDWGGECPPLSCSSTHKYTCMHRPSNTHSYVHLGNIHTRKQPFAHLLFMALFTQHFRREKQSFVSPLSWWKRHFSVHSVRKCDEPKSLLRNSSLENWINKYKWIHLTEWHFHLIKAENQL